MLLASARLTNHRLHKLYADKLLTNIFWQQIFQKMVSASQ